MTAALRSRIINTATGDEYLRASIGQIYYFDDRRVTLDGIPDTNKSSDIIADISGTLGNWSATASMQWDIQQHNSAKHNASLHYESGNNTILNLGYSNRRETLTNPEALEQTDISFVAPTGTATRPGDNSRYIIRELLLVNNYCITKEPCLIKHYR